MGGLGNKVWLITYPDSLGRNLKDLDFVLNKYIKDAVGGIHILPFYPSSADRGFCPLTHLKVDSKFGDWRDIKRIASRYDLMADLMVNHLSSESKYFKDYLKKKDKSKYRNLFLLAKDVFGENVDFRLLRKIYRPRPTDPFTEYRFEDGTFERVWTTFTSNQIDLNWNSNVTKKIMHESAAKLAKNGVKILRLDAAGYAAKELGTNCFFLPKTYKIINGIKRCLKEYGVKMLPEVHGYYKLQKEIAGKEDYVYDFALPILVLHTLFSCNAKKLKKWIKVRPHNCFTTLDTHDGIGVVDSEGLLTRKESDEVVSNIYKSGGNAAMRASGANSENVDIYQVNSTYHSALGKNDKAYLCARAIQFFLPGIPQVYYVGMLAGKNDVKLLSKTKHGRDINRHYYTIAEIEKNMKRRVVKKLFELMRIRNTHPAFDGDFKLHRSGNDKLRMSWTKGSDTIELRVDLKDYSFEILGYC